MSILRLSNPRLMLAVALEGALAFAVLYALAIMTLAVLPEQGRVAPFGQVAVTSLLLVSFFYTARRSTQADEGGLRREVALTSVVSLGLGVLVFAAYWLLSGSPQRLPAFLMLEGSIAVPAAMAGWRWFSLRYNLLTGWRERVLILGTGEPAREVCRWISEHRSADYTVIGFADEDRNRQGQVLAMGARIQTDYGSLPQFCPKRADRVIVALEEKRGKLPIEELIELRMSGLPVEDATSFIERASGKLNVETMLPSWLIFSDGFKASPVRLAIKRLSDVVLSLLLLAVAAPVMALVAVLIRLDTPGPALFRQKRMGIKGREFEVLKFRSMATEAETMSGPVWAREDDPRITRVGKILRRLRFDELPQLFNVLRGEMSFVGPRPERRHFVFRLEHSIPYFRLRMAVRPGITGWAQVQYRYGANLEESREKLKYDLYYIKNCDLFLDLWIVLKTVRVVLFGSGAR